MIDRFTRDWSRDRRIRLILALALVALGISALPALGQQADRPGVRPGDRPGAQGDKVIPPLRSVEILVLDKDTDEELRPLRQGEILDLEVGQTYRLRVTGISERGVRRWPSARFWVEQGDRGVTLSRANETTGRVLVTGNRADARQPPTVIGWEILQPITPRQLQSGSVRVRVTPAVETDRPGWPNRPDRPDEGYVTLYEHDDFRGQSQSFLEDVSDLRRTPFGQDRASSLTVSEGCRAIVYQDVGYRGASEILVGDVRSLSRTRVGNDSISSLRVECRGR